MYRFTFGLAAALVLGGVGAVRADQTWAGTTGDWALDSNWSTAVPTNENATVGNGGTAQIGGAAARVYTLYNNSGSAIEVNNGGSIRVRDNLENAGGTLTVGSGGTLTFCGQAIQAGATIVNSGGTLNFGASDDSSWSRIGNNLTNVVTTFRINGGTVNAQYTEADGVVVGDYWTRTMFTMSSGAHLDLGTNRLNVGWWSGGWGLVSNSGSTISFANDGGLWVGAGGALSTGRLVLADGGTVTKTTNSTQGELLVGTWSAGNIGALEVRSGASIAWKGGRVCIASTGAVGTLVMDGASSWIDTGNQEFQVGNDTGSVGTVTINDGTLTTHSWTAISRNGGNGHLIINGGTMNVQGNEWGGYLQVVAGAGGTGVIDINDGVLNVTANGGMIRYQDWGEATVSSWGTINLNGGRLIAGDIARKNPAETINHAVFNFNGGVLQPTGTTGDLHDIESAYILGGGAIVELAGNSMTISQALLDGGGGGGLVVRGNGVFNPESFGENMLILTSYSNTFTGEFVVTNGAHVRLGYGALNTGDGMLGAATSILLDNGGLKNNFSSEPVLGASRAITLGAGGGFFTIGWGDLSMAISGKVTGVGHLNVCRDGGNLVLANAANDYAGDTRVGTDGPGHFTNGWQAGLFLGADEVIPDGAGKGNLILDGGYGGHLNLNGHNETINGLWGTNGVALRGTNGVRIYNSGAAATLTVGNNNADGRHEGMIENDITLRKIGAGELELANTYDLGKTGETRVEAGVLRLSGEQPGTNAIRMIGGALRLDQALHVTRQAGLLAGMLTNRLSMDPWAMNPTNRGVELTTTMLNTNRDLTWGDYSEYVYSGALYVSAAQAGAWTFAENIDDATWLAVDGAVVLNDGTWNLPTRVTITLAEGWHNIDVRGQNGNGGFGPSNAGWLTNNLGFVYKLGAGTDNAADYSAMTDSGSGGFLRTWKNLALPNAVHLDSNSTIQVAADGHDWSLGGVIDGGGDLSKTGAGKLSLLAANTMSGRVAVGEGVLAIGGAGSLDNSPGIHVEAGAMLDLSGSPTFIFKMGQTLSGDGTVTGNVHVAGTVSPGALASTLNFANDLTLDQTGEAIMEIAMAGAALTNDQVVVADTLTYSGTLVVTNLGVTLTTNDSFTLFTASSFNGWFSNLNLPPLADDLVWDTAKLRTTGVLTVTLYVAPPTVTTEPVTGVGFINATVGGVVTRENGSSVAERGVVYNTAGLPTVADTRIVCGSGTGAFSVALTSLDDAQTYYVRAYASNGSGLAYGNEQSFTTWTQAVPTLTSPTATGIGETAATLGATITDDGGAAILERGTFWGTAANPAGNALAEGGTALGAFSHPRSGLPAGTRIYFRGYASNSVGIAYSPESSFWTRPTAPSGVHAADIGTNSFTAAWQPSTGATNYLLDVATDAGFVSLVEGYSGRSVGTDTAHVVTGLGVGITHYFRVRAENAGGVSGNSATAVVPPPLSVGDLAIIGRSNDGTPDVFVIVTLTNIPAGQVAYYTDNGWSNAEFRGASPTDGDGAENLVRLTFQQDVSAGTIIASTDAAPAWAWATGGESVPGAASGVFAHLELSADGDQIYTFQGTASNPLANTRRQIFAINDGGAGWTPATADTNGAVAPGLIDGYTAVFFSNRTARLALDMTRATTVIDSKEGWLEYIANPSNWLFDAGGPLPAGRLTVFAARPPDLEVYYGTNHVVSGDGLPTSAKGTDFGGTNLGETVEREFVVTNRAAGDLVISNVTILGAQASDFMVVSPPASNLMGNAGGAMRLAFHPSATGIRTALVSLANNDPYDSPYTFAVRGVGTEGAALVTFTSASMTVSETAGVVQVAVRISWPVDATALVAVAEGGATAGSDFAQLSTQVVFSADGGTMQNLALAILDDAFMETNETLRLELREILGAEAGAVTSLVVTIADDEDSDQDGILDSWERAWFGDLSHGPTEDLDNDGFGNRAEFIALTNPTNGNSYCRIDQVAAAQRSIGFQAASGRVYEVEYHGLPPATNWNNLSTINIYVNGPISVQDPAVTTGRTYRVRVRLQ